jgi:hypothetical protein
VRYVARVRETRNASGRPGYFAICERYSSASGFLDILNQRAVPSVAMILAQNVMKVYPCFVVLVILFLV